MIFDLPVFGHWIAQRSRSFVLDLIVFAFFVGVVRCKRDYFCEQDTSPVADRARWSQPATDRGHVCREGVATRSATQMSLCWTSTNSRMTICCHSKYRDDENTRRRNSGPPQQHEMIASPKDFWRTRTMWCKVCWDLGWVTLSPLLVQWC